MGRGWLFALVVMAGSARADEPVDFGDGIESSVEVAAGASLSTMAKSLAFSELGELGYFATSSTRQALSVEAIESFHLVADGTTPTFGLIAAGARRIHRNFAGNDFERLGFGLALSLRGTTTGLGVGATVGLGEVGLGGMGVAFHLDAYTFGPIGGTDRVLLLGLGYVASPVANLRPASPERPPEPEPPPPIATPCPQEQAVVEALVRHRKAAVVACNAHASNCKAEQEKVVVLGADLTVCREGEAVEVPGD